jgi:hypothetical protein
MAHEIMKKSEKDTHDLEKTADLEKRIGII